MSLVTEVLQNILSVNDVTGAAEDVVISRMDMDGHGDDDDDHDGGGDDDGDDGDIIQKVSWPLCRYFHRYAEEKHSVNDEWAIA